MEKFSWRKKKSRGISTKSLVARWTNKLSKVRVARKKNEAVWFNCKSITKGPSELHSGRNAPPPPKGSANCPSSGGKLLLLQFQKVD
jgi:hypothetical protein